MAVVAGLLFFLGVLGRSVDRRRAENKTSQQDGAWCQKLHAHSDHSSERNRVRDLSIPILNYRLIRGRMAGLDTSGNDRWLVDIIVTLLARRPCGGEMVYGRTDQPERNLAERAGGGQPAGDDAGMEPAGAGGGGNRRPLHRHSRNLQPE